MKLNNITHKLIQEMKTLSIINQFSESLATHNFSDAQSLFPAKHDLIWEILIASNICFGTDAEDGRVPPNYKWLMEAIIQQLYPEIQETAIKMEHEMLSHQLHFRADKELFGALNDKVHIHKSASMRGIISWKARL